jgi:hypothetical protein
MHYIENTAVAQRIAPEENSLLCVQFSRRPRFFHVRIEDGGTWALASTEASALKEIDRHFEPTVFRFDQLARRAKRKALQM